MTASAGPGDIRLSIESAVKESAVWISIRGEADASNLGHLDAVLNSIVLDGQKVVWLDLSDLEFIDVATLRQLATFAMHVRQGGRDFRTLGAPPLVRSAIRILDGRDHLGLA